MIQFAWPWIFYFLPLPLLIRYLTPQANAHKTTPLQVPFYSLLKNIISNNFAKSQYNKYSLALILIWLALLLSAARPQLLGSPVEIKTSGRDLLIALDVSGSMQAQDLGGKYSKKTRLDIVKELVAEFVAKRAGDRVGLILFGSQAFLQVPLTFDLDTIKQFSHDAQIGIAGEKTAIGDAIGQAIKHFRNKNAQEKVLILLSDGSNNIGFADPIHAAEIAKSEGLQIYTIGIGAKSKEVDTFFGRQVINPSADLDEDALRKIASITQGDYFRATDKKSLKAIYSKIDKLKPIRVDIDIYRPITEYYYIPLAIALLFSLITTSLYIYAKKRKYSHAS